MECIHLKRVLYASFFLLILTLLSGGNTLAAETSIKSGVPIQANLTSKSGMNKYQFTTDKDGEFYLTLEQATSGLSVKVYDVYGNYVSGSSSSSGGKNHFIEGNLSKGSYYIEVKPYNWSSVTSASYRLKATFENSFTRDSATFEPNDTMRTSKAIKVGEFLTSKLETNVDQDIYQFTTNRDGEVYIALDKTTAGFSIKLYDMYGVMLTYDDGWAGGDHLSIDTELTKGTYYVKITPTNWGGVSSASYRIKATYPSTFNRNNKTFEPNDTFETAMPLISKQLYSTDLYSVIDQDAYQFKTEKTGKAFITVNNVEYGGFYAMLYDQNKNLIDGDSVLYGGQTIEFEENLPKGTYYIKVVSSHWNGVMGAKYKLKATFADKAPSVDSIYNTGTVLTGTAVSGAKVYAVVGSTKIGDTIARNGKYSIKIPKQKAETKISVYIIDSAGIKSSSSTTTVVNASIKVASTGYNKLKVSWAQVPGNQGYEIYRSTSSKGTYNKVGTVTNKNTLSYTNSSLVTGKTYYYKVRAYRTVNGKKVYGQFSDVGYGKSTLAMPSKLTVSKSNSTFTKASWSKVSEATGYQVYRATSKSGSYTNVKTVTSGSSISYADTKLKKGKTYYYKVRAYRTVNGKKIYSSYTSIVSVKM